MIHVMTLGEVAPEVVEHVCKRLFSAYGVGAEVAGEAELPEEAYDEERGGYLAPVLLKEAETVSSFADDKVLYVTNRPLLLPVGPMGPSPDTGFAIFGGDRAVVTDHPPVGRKGDAADPEIFAKRAAHEVGHLFELHHCPEARCAMQPPWSEAFLENPAVLLCPFCREKSERRIRMGKQART